MKSITLLFTVPLIAGLVHAQEFQVPESAAYDPLTHRYFISNFGDGNIIQIDSTGRKSCFQTGLSKSLGMVMRDSTLFVVTNLKMVKGFNVLNGTQTFKIQIHEAVFLNDITHDDAGNLYVTDSNGDAVYQINIADKTYSLLVKTETDNPNGIVYDKSNNRLVLCHFREKAAIDEIKLDDHKLTTILKTGLDNLDGLGLDASGNFYVSSWGAGSFSTGFQKSGTVYQYDNQFKMKPKVVSTGHHGPADIFCNKDRHELVIPLFLENDVKFIPIK
jgi:sugar lactone lactonase YvrE